MPPKKQQTGRWRPQKATKSALEKFDEAFEKDMSPFERPEIKFYSTGSLELDYHLAVGGWPTGRVVEVWGPEHAGKTTLAIFAAISAQQKFPDRIVAWIDMEQTFDERYAQSLGLDTSPSRWRLYTPTTAEETADAAKRYMTSGLCSLVVLDSVGGMIARVEFEKEADEETVGKVPKIVTRMVKACSPIGAAVGTTTMVINQVRAIIGGHGATEDTSGGWALKHVTTMKVQVRRGETHRAKVGEQEVPVGHAMMCRIQKNKMGPYGARAEVWFHNRETTKFGPMGIDVASETFKFSKRLGLFGTGGGGWYDMPDGERIRSEPKVLEYLREHPEIMAGLREKIIASQADLVGTEEDVEEDALNMAEVIGS